MLVPLEILVTLCAGAFAGAAIYVSAVEHPARVSCGNALALREFVPSYQRGTIMQASLAMVGLVAGAAAWWLGGSDSMLVGGLLLGAVVPFTLLAIFPTNRRLLADDLDPESPEATTLLRRWGRLHAVRSALGVLAFAILVVSLAWT